MSLTSPRMLQQWSFTHQYSCLLHFRFAGAAAHSAAKPTTPVKGKAVRGAQRTPIKAVSKSQAGGVAKAPPKDPKLEQAKKKGLDKARETMRVKSTAKKTDSSTGTWAQRNDDFDRTFVIDWLDGGRPATTVFWRALSAMESLIKRKQLTTPSERNKPLCPTWDRVCSVRAPRNGKV